MKTAIITAALIATASTASAGLFELGKSGEWVTSYSTADAGQTCTMASEGTDRDKIYLFAIMDNQGQENIAISIEVNRVNYEGNPQRNTHLSVDGETYTFSDSEWYTEEADLLEIDWLWDGVVGNPFDFFVMMESGLNLELLSERGNPVSRWNLDGFGDAAMVWVDCISKMGPSA